MADDVRSASGLVDVLDRVLEKGIVIDAYVRVSLVGLEVISVDARVVVASIQTYLAHADDLAYTASVARPYSVAPTAVPILGEPLPPERPSLVEPGPDTPLH